MAKTAEFAKPRTINKRGQRRNLYDNKARRLLDPGTVSKRNFREIEQVVDHRDGIPEKTKAEVATLRNYFDDDWFDGKFYIRTEKILKIKDEKSKKKGTYYQPMRCTECGRPFQQTVTSKHSSKYVHLNSEVFMNMPLIKGRCHGCQS
jgi:hypothetical protein